MKAIVAHSLGEPETFRIDDVAPLPMGPRDLRVAVHYAGVSFVDVLTAGGNYQIKPPTPYIPGSELSGIVIEVGAEVSGFSPGDRVAAGGFGGVFAEEAVVSCRAANRIPDNVALAEAAILRASYLTSCYALRHRANMQPGEVVLVLGAGGAVGIAAVQIAVAYGAVVIASASTAAKRDFALANGAAHAIDSASPHWRDELKALTGGRGADVVIDPLGGSQTERAFRALAWNGRHVVIGFATGEIPALPTNLPLLKGGILMAVDLKQVGAREPAVFDQVSAEVTRLFAAGEIRPQIAEIYDFTDFVPAMRTAAAGLTTGRLVLRMPAASAGDPLRDAEPRADI
jgi:NADPH2:quinone reductase